jgi:hypothetical protein
VYPEQWRLEALAREADPDRGGPKQALRLERAVRDGYQAARRLRELMARSGREAPPLPSYLAVVVQDLDSMGLFLSGRAGAASGQKIGIDPNGHGRVSRDLLLVAQRQSDVLKSEELLAVPVYAGGDDLLAFAPASTAIDAAQACHAEIPATLPYATSHCPATNDGSATGDHQRVLLAGDDLAACHRGPVPDSRKDDKRGHRLMTWRTHPTSLAAQTARCRSGRRSSVARMVWHLMPDMMYVRARRWSLQTRGVLARRSVAVFVP